LGASIGNRQKRVFLMSGDGGFMLNLGELGTAVQEQLPVTVVIFNDGGYGILRTIQDQEFMGRRCAVDLFTPSFEHIANAFRIPYLYVDSGSQVREALDSSRSCSGPVIIEINSLAIGPMKVPYQRTSALYSGSISGHHKAVMT
ncbi:MAG: hypothetical protein K8F30_10365, partial [Taibaiella sp.]|nr:hypothetical protein [Taibaiella sp.]